MTREERWRRRVFRVTLGFWILGWGVKVFYLGPALLLDAFRYPVTWEGMPTLLQAPLVSALAYALPFTALAALACPTGGVRRLTAPLVTLCALALCAHLNTFNDATFVTSLWVGLWLTWFAWRPAGRPGATLLHGRVLAQCLVAMLFLGGLTGKLIPAYWSGEALHNIYFLQKPNLPWRWLREILDADALRASATWLSRATLAMEACLGLLPFAPWRGGAIGGVLVMGGIALLSTPNLLSVFACLMGLLLALLLPGPQAASAKEEPSVA